MKLFTRYSRINLITTVAIFLLASMSYYFLLKYVLVNQVDKDLEIEEDEIQTYVQKNSRLPENVEVEDQPITYEPVKEPGKRNFDNIKLPHKHRSKHHHFRRLQFYIQVQQQWYEVNVGKSLEGTDAIIRSVILITLLTIILILTVTLLFNRLILRRLWQPFYHTLAQVKHFELGNTALQLPQESTDEFQLLNTTLQQALGKAERDYQLLKQFTENASHETQTPLAIIRSKLDLLIQDEQLSSGQSQHLQGAYQAIQRLSHLNQSLLLLTRIENGQFYDKDTISITGKVQDKLEQFKELWESKQLQITTSLPEVLIHMNNELADLLLNNLFSNVTRYCTEKGSVTITLTAAQLSISNTGAHTPLPENKLFSRFFKQGVSGESNGLGLSIIQQICTVSGFTPGYHYHEGIHTFTIRFQS